MPGVVSDVQRYYHTVAPFIAAELANRGDAPMWRDIGQRHRRGRILEIGCGGGRVTALLAEAGAEVVGIDLSPELLACARRARVKASLVLADVRDLALRAQFDAIIAADDPFSHLTRSADRDRALTCIAAHLAPGGIFVLDALWFPPGQANKIEARDVTLDGGSIHVTERWRCNRRTHVCATEYDYDRGSGALTRARFDARYWTAAELSNRLRRVGLEIVGRWGGYEGQSWHQHGSQRLVIEARAQGRRS